MKILGAVCGDIAGSRYEFHNIKTMLLPGELINFGCRFTDDTVLTCGVADALLQKMDSLPDGWFRDEGYRQAMTEQFCQSIRSYGQTYLHVGYGGRFRRWLQQKDTKPYGSWGNGSAMRVSFAGWAASSMEEALALGELSAAVTHDHPEGIKGAQVVAGSIFLLRQGGGKDALRQFVSQYYPLDFTLDEIRPDYHFDVSCQGSVPPAVMAVLEGENFCDVLSRAISIGGDSDTVAAIAGSIAEVLFPIPQFLADQAWEILDDQLQDLLTRASARFRP